MSRGLDPVAAAHALLRAERTRTQMGHLSLAHPGMGMDDAYRVQKALVDLKLAEGRRQIGWKIGLTSRAMQDALGIDIPDSGVLLDDMVFEHEGEVPKGRFIQPRVEAEAHRIGTDKNPVWYPSITNKLMSIAAKNARNCATRYKNAKAQRHRCHEMDTATRT